MLIAYFFNILCIYNKKYNFIADNYFLLPIFADIEE